MAERIVSPGVFTNEVDQSYLAGGVAQIGAAIVGPTTKGPALVPTKVTSYGEFEAIFGGFTDESYVPYVVQDYLRYGNVMTVTRLLYEDGYKLSQGALAVVATSGSVSVVSHVLHPTLPVTTDGATNVFESSTLLSGSNGSFAFKVSGSYSAAADDAIGFSAFLQDLSTTAISASIVSSNNDYIAKVFGNSAKSLDYPVYVAYENKNATSAFNSITNVGLTLVKLNNFEHLQDYSTAATPWITSQKIGVVAKDLLRFHTLSHGTSTNYEVKVGIRDIRTATEVSDPNGYGTFTVEVRKVNTLSPGIVDSPYSSTDTDNTPDRVEQFLNVNLDPDSPKYIGRVIGDRYQTVDTNGNLLVNGDYPNKSKYIRVEVTDSVVKKTNNKTLIPFGFRAPYSPIPMAGAANLVAASYVTSQTISSVFSANNFHGFDFTNANNMNFLAPLVTSGSTVGNNTDFYLGDVTQAAAAGYPTLSTAYSGSIETALNAGTIATNVALATRKFIVPLQGGFDGAKPNLKKYSGANISATNTFGFNCQGSTTTGTVAYNKAFTLLSNTDYYDMNLLVTPGIIHSLHPRVTANARALAENRQDTFYVMDSNELTDTLDTVTSTITELDSNYTATYWPWVRTTNPTKNVPVWVPSSVMIPGVLAFNDSVSAPWYAPAGLNRGGLTAVTDTYKRLSQSDRDSLYEARINPIANFLNDGICVWGQKTLQARPSALDRVNVRRLLIEVKKFIASSTRYLVFEQNTTATRNRFLSIVNPYMENVRAKQGLYAFRVVMDQSNNTADLIDQNILYGQIFLQPTRTAEFIILDFNIQPTGASFPNA
jgi:hypothetical protein